MIKKEKILVIVGPTASGKTGLAVDLARKFNGEIISADSRQVYRGMDIGTGKDLMAYGDVPYHLIDIVEPNEAFDLAQFKKLAEVAITEIIGRGKLPIIVGGTGLYVEALVDNFQLSEAGANQQLRDDLESKSIEELLRLIDQVNPSFAAKINQSDAHNQRRLVRYAEVMLASGQVASKAESAYVPLILMIDWPKEELQARIEKRLLERLEEQEMVEEVNDLNRQGVSWQRLESFGLEYKFIAWYLQEKVDYEQMVERLKKASWQFAKRQLTWLKRWRKLGAKIEKVTPDELSSVDQMLVKFLQD